MRTKEKGTVPQWDGGNTKRVQRRRIWLEQKYEEVVKWIRKAVEQGNAGAPHGLEKLMK